MHRKYCALGTSVNQDVNMRVLRLNKRRSKILDVTVKKVKYFDIFAISFRTDYNFTVVLASEWFEQLCLNSLDVSSPSFRKT